MKSNYKLFISFALLLLSVNIHGQNRYHVVDAESGEPLPCVCMYVAENKGTWTNDEGDAVLEIGDNEQVRISCVGYKTLFLKKSELKRTIKLSPLTREMREVGVESDELLLEKVAKKLNKESIENKEYRVPFFSRITLQAPNKSEMIECFFEAGPIGTIRLLKLYEGLSYNISEEGEGESNLRETDIQNIFYLGPTTENNEFWPGYEAPLHPGVTRGWLKKNYHISSEILNEENGESLRCITLKPKFKNANLIGGKVYVRPSSLDLVCFEGETDRDVYVSKVGGKKKKSHPTINFVINYTRRNGISEADNLKFSFIADDVKCRTVMVNMGQYDFEDNLGWPKMIDYNFVDVIHDAGHNPQLNKYLSIMKRTEVEDDLTGELFAENKSKETSKGKKDAVKSLPKWRNALPQEKVYLHLDNTGYFKGETIWFKAYLVRTDTEKRGNLSSVLYVDLVSPQGDVIASKKVNVTQGIGAGSITLDNAVLPTGFYELRAYTRYMTGWNTNSCFSRIIPIFRTPQKEGDYIPVMDKETRLTAAETEKEEKVAFYPEGGYLVKGLPSRLAYVIKGTRGTVDIPAQEDPKSVEITFNGSTRSYNLPQAKDEGITMRVDALRNDSLTMDLWSTSSFRGKELGYALIHSGKVLSSETFKAQKYQRFSISRNLLPDGVSQITVFDPEEGALADRLVFRCPEYEDSLKIQTATTKLLPCGKVSLDITAEPFTSLSFSAMDAGSIVNGKRGNIKTWMLLGSDLKGYIANPEYYFESDDEEHRKAADLLMMIQGWRRYNWDVMNGQKKMIALQPYESKLAIDGRIKAKKGTNADVSKVKITASLRNGEENLAFSVETDSTGYYAFILPDLQGEWSLSLMAYKDGISDKYIIPINRHFSPDSRNPEEFEIKQIPTDGFQIHHWDIPEENEAVWKKFLDVKGITMREVSVRKRKFDNFDGEGFFSEKNAQINSSLYYDCEKAVEEFLDSGEEPPYLTDWLIQKDKMFKGGNPTDKALWAAIGNTSAMATQDSIFLPGMIFDISDMRHLGDLYPDVDYSNYEDFSPNYWVPVWGDGLEINGRPVIWMINNLFSTVTNLKLRTNVSVYDGLDKSESVRGQLIKKNPRCAPAMGRLTKTTTVFPELLEDVKSLYIAEGNNLVYQITHSTDIESLHPYLVYCYTKPETGTRKVKGIRYTSFHGFDPVEVFQTEDYNELPPMDDFRRTLYWNPNVWTDKDGKAHVEFWNNSTCTDMIISAEGITDNGKYVIGR